MASITIRRLDDSVKTELRVRAAQHGRSMEEEAREILRSALKPASVTKESLVESIRARFAPFGGMELPKRKREPVRTPPRFGQ